MKKLTILSIALILFSGISVASSYQAIKAIPDNKAKITKYPAKKDVKKVPRRTRYTKKGATNHKSINQ